MAQYKISHAGQDDLDLRVVRGWQTLVHGLAIG
jgi:hypothetical protein